MYSPRPAESGPDDVWCFAGWTSVNGSKIRWRSVSAIPMPLSRTRSRTQSPGYAWRGAWSSCTVIAPLLGV